VRRVSVVRDPLIGALALPSSAVGA